MGVSHTIANIIEQRCGCSCCPIYPPLPLSTSSTSYRRRLLTKSSQAFNSALYSDNPCTEREDALRPVKIIPTRTVDEPEPVSNMVISLNHAPDLNGTGRLELIPSCEQSQSLKPAENDSYILSLCYISRRGS